MTTNELYQKVVLPYISGSQKISVVPSFISSSGSDDIFLKLKSDFNNILQGREVNLIIFDEIYRQCIYENILKVYENYVQCIDEKNKNVIEEITSFGTKIKFDKLEMILEKHVKTLNTLQMAVSSNSKNISSEIDVFDFIKRYCIIILMFQNPSLFQLLDDIIKENLHDLEIIQIIVKNIKLEKIIDSPIDDTALKFLESKNIIIECVLNIQELFLKNVHRLSEDMCIDMIHFLRYQENFTKMYEKYLPDRILQQREKSTLEMEKRLLKQLMTYNIDDVKSIEIMEHQIDDMIRGLEITYILGHNVDVIKESEKYKNILIDPTICHFHILNEKYWKISNELFENKLADDLEVYIDIFMKLKQIINKYDNVIDETELKLDIWNSTGIIEIEISDNTYSFLVSLQQMNVLIEIMKLHNASYENLLDNLKMTQENLNFILDGLCNCKLLNNHDRVYSINQLFFFKENNVSLLDLLKTTANFDFRVLNDLKDIIRNNKVGSMREIFDKYVEMHGFTNYNFIEMMFNYMKKIDSIKIDNGVYVVNE